MEERGGLAAPTDCRLEHQGPTSYEVGMKERADWWRGLRRSRLKHQGPTSYEVGM